LDEDSKKKLIDELSRSLNKQKQSSYDLKNVFGEWKDSKTADEIIEDIEDSRFNDRDIEEF
jgi:hypothetical protein